MAQLPRYSIKIEQSTGGLPSSNEWTEQNELLELIHLKFQSGNDIPVERITLTRSELESAFPGWLKS
jgi:hypothetical protein